MSPDSLPPVRRAGLALPLSALLPERRDVSVRGPAHAAGALGQRGRDFVDFLRAAGLSEWLLLPWHPPNGFESPYQARSAFAGDTRLVCLAELARDGWLEERELARSAHDPAGRRELFELARARVSTRADVASDLARFREREAHWLADWCLHTALRAVGGSVGGDEAGSSAPRPRPWPRWPADLRRREPAALERARRELGPALATEEFAQFLFDRQFVGLGTYAAERGVHLWGDFAIFVGVDSADAWCTPAPLGLTRDGLPRATVGTPPDGYHRAGQDWGLPAPRWSLFAEDDFAWWRHRVARERRFAGALRWDHFGGYDRLWCWDDAGRGSWEEAPGFVLERALTAGGMRAPRGFAEDLGALRERARRLRRRFGLSTSCVFVYAFGTGRGDARHLPHRFPNDAVAQVSTHDSDTWVGTWNGAAPVERARCARYLGVDPEAAPQVHAERALELVWQSRASTVFAPVQDVLALGSETRINVPGEAAGNWTWRVPEGAWSCAAAERLRATNRAAGRLR